jgi:hypothetical protein
MTRRHLWSTLAALALALAGCGGEPPTAPTPTPTPAPLTSPTGLTATASSGQVALAWNAVAGATAYRVFRAGTAIADRSTTSYTDTGLTNRSQYCYSVRALQNDREGYESAAACATPEPNFSGTWVGVTSQGFPLTFVVANNSVSSFMIGARATEGGCLDSETTTIAGPAALSDDTFQLTAEGWQVTGRFTSEGAATGAAVYTVRSGGCAGLPTGVTWTATRTI